MKTNAAHLARRSRSPRFGYDRRWWGRAARATAAEPSYWEATRRPLTSLAFVLPLLAAYEIGVWWLGPDGTSARTGADAWMRHALARLGLTDRWLPPLGVVMALLGWQAIDARPWRLRPGCLAGMAAESLVLAVALIGMSRVVDLGLAHLEGSTLLAAGGSSATAVVGFLGAGVYEEALFRLALIPLLYGSFRLFQMPNVLAGTLAVTGSALLFSLAHHVGAPGEPFSWFAFVFRWLAGVYFAWVFVARGFGVAVGTHAAYDLLVGLS